MNARFVPGTRARAGKHEAKSKFVQLISISSNRPRLGPANLRRVQEGTLPSTAPDISDQCPCLPWLVPVAPRWNVPDVRGLHRQPAAGTGRHRCLRAARECKYQIFSITLRLHAADVGPGGRPATTLPPSPAAAGSRTRKYLQFLGRRFIFPFLIYLRL